jgi:hypothetical protein
LLVAAALLLAGCQAGGGQVAVFTWDFYKLRENATDKDAAFKSCEAGARRRFRFVADRYAQAFGYAGAVLDCMRFEGWGQTKRAVDFKPALAPPG